MLALLQDIKQVFSWTDECEEAFQELKHYLSNPPLLSSSKEGENLYLYLAISTTAISAILIREEDKKQPRIAIKVQALADFIAEFTLPDEDGLTDETERWTIHTDGSSAQKKGGVGVVIITPEGETFKYRV